MSRKFSFDLCEDVYLESALVEVDLCFVKGGLDNWFGQLPLVFQAANVVELRDCVFLL